MLDQIGLFNPLVDLVLNHVELSLITPCAVCWMGREDAYFGSVGTYSRQFYSTTLTAKEKRNYISD